MRSLTATALLMMGIACVTALLISSCFPSHTEPVRKEIDDIYFQYYSRVAGKGYVFEVTSELLKEGPEFTLGHELPLLFMDAVALAVKAAPLYLSSSPSTNGWHVSGVELVRIELSPYWIYLVKFSPDVRAVGSGIEDGLRIPVLLDGRLVSGRRER